MVEWVIAFVVFILAFVCLALGLLHGRSGIQGSCGGLNNIPGVESDCGGRCRAVCNRRGSTQDEDSDR